MVKFEKGDSIKARFTFELTSDDRAMAILLVRNTTG
jgi:hypothetical protein